MAQTRGDGNGTRPRPTMSNVATAAGVSLKTVSRVVNDERPSQRIVLPTALIVRGSGEVWP